MPAAAVELARMMFGCTEVLLSNYAAAVGCAPGEIATMMSVEPVSVCYANLVFFS
jgi:hypothetical protein